MNWTPLAGPLLPPLQPGQVHLVHLPLTHASRGAARVEALLSADEYARADRFAFPHLRDAFVLARGTLRALLGGLLALPPAALRFAVGPYGKPSLEPRPAHELRFNLSHSGEHALLAFALGRELGVDLEQARPEVDVAAVGQWVFSAQEQRALAALPASVQRSAFFQLWARKEALIKAEGTGFAEPSAAFTLTAEPHLPPRLIAHDTRPAAVARWSLRDLPVLAGYSAALAVEGPPPELLAWRLPGA